MFHAKLQKKIKTHILYSKTSSKNRDSYEVMWKNRIDGDRPHVCCVEKCPLHAEITMTTIQTHTFFIKESRE
jgi:hypothetical protein